MCSFAAPFARSSSLVIFARPPSPPRAAVLPAAPLVPSAAAPLAAALGLPAGGGGARGGCVAVDSAFGRSRVEPTRELIREPRCEVGCDAAWSASARMGARSEVGGPAAAITPRSIATTWSA